MTVVSRACFPALHPHTTVENPPGNRLTKPSSGGPFRGQISWVNKYTHYTNLHWHQTPHLQHIVVRILLNLQNSNQSLAYSICTQLNGRYKNNSNIIIII